MVYLREGLVAAWVIALVWLLPCMDSQVLLQGRILGESLSTSLKVTRRG